MLSFFVNFLALSSLFTTGTTAATPQPPAELFSPLITTKVQKTALAYSDAAPKYPQYTNINSPGAWLLFGPDTWTSGFLPATMYALVEREDLCGSDGVNWLALGRKLSAGLVPLEIKNGVGHDTGFLSFPFVDELDNNPSNATAIKAVHAFAGLLAARFNSKVGCTRSWDTADPTRFQVIIDNMMNLEVLFVSSDLQKNQTLIDIAIAHADRTMVEHLRSDGSSYHVVEYNATLGTVVGKYTSQGFSDSSTWTRGQAWGIYGFANMYRRTGLLRYIQTSRKMANLLLSRLPADGVVPWDFDAPAPRPADSSAATIGATALLLLAQQEESLGNSAAALTWTTAAIKLLTSITNLAWQPSTTWQSLLSNGTVNIPAGNKNTGTVYGDYYYIKAGNELVKMGLAEC